MLMAIGGFVIGVIYGNPSVVELGIIGGFALSLAWIFLGGSFLPGVKDVKVAAFGGGWFTQFCGFWSLATWPLFISIPLAGVCFINNSAIGTRTYEKIWVIDDEVNLGNKILFAVPFLQKIRAISSAQDVNNLVVATTKDNIQIKGHLRAELRLVSDESTILRAMKTLTSPDMQVKRELERMLEEQFRDAIASRDLADLQNNLVLEWETGKNISGKSLTALGLEWAGTLAITDLHVHFGKG